MRVSPIGKQAHLRSQNGSFPVNMKAAALEHKIIQPVAVRIFQFTDFTRNGIIGIPWKIQAVHKPSPGIKCPVTGAPSTLIIYQKCRPAVSAPGIIRAHFNHPDILRETRPGICILPAAYQHCHRSKPAYRLCHIGISLLCRLCSITPVICSFRPYHIDSFLRFKLSRHPIAILFRSCIRNSPGHSFTLLPSVC